MSWPPYSVRRNIPDSLQCKEEGGGGGGERGCREGEGEGGGGGERGIGRYATHPQIIRSL